MSSGSSVPAEDMSWDDMHDNMTSGCYLPGYGKKSKPSNKTMTTQSITSGYGLGTLSTSGMGGAIIPGNLSIVSTATSSTGYSIFTQPSATGIHVKGDATFDGDIKIKGVNLGERLDKIEDRLAILRPNEKLEETWDELKALGDRYRELEKELLEKQAVWDLLRK